MGRSWAVVGPTFCAPERRELTMRRKPSGFHGGLFTVTDPSGDVVFQVERTPNQSNRASILLKDAAGSSLLTLQPKELTLRRRWTAMPSRSSGQQQDHLFSVRKALSTGGFTAEVNNHNNSKNNNSNSTELKNHYFIQDFHPQRSCEIRSPCKTVAAKVAPIFENGGARDVWRVEVEGGFDQAFVVAVVVMLQRIVEKGEE